MGISRCLAVLLVAVMLAGSCNPFRRKRTPAPPITVVKPPPPQPEPEPAEQAAPIPPPPALDTPAADVPSVPASVELPHAAPPPQESSARTSTEAPATVAPGQPVGPVAVPQLTQLLTRDEIARYNSEIDANLRAVQKHVDVVSRRRINEQQAVALDRIRTLARQAADMRTADLETARGLATRALVLARDLENTTR